MWLRCEMVGHWVGWVIRRFGGCVGHGVARRAHLWLDEFVGVGR